MAIRRLGLTPFHRRSFLALQRTLAGDQLELDLLADPSASADTHELLARELTPVMADDAMLDALDLASLELTAPGLTARYVPDKRRLRPSGDGGSARPTAADGGAAGG